MGIERHIDMVLNLGTLTAGQIIPSIQLPMDSDAPFVLRALGGYQVTDGGTAEELIAPLPAALLMRLADADGNWLQNARTPGMVSQPQQSDFIPMAKHTIYPARGVAQMEFENLAGGTIEGIVIILRGVKLYPGDRNTAPCYAPTYPDCYSQMPFQYAVDFNLAGGAADLLNQPLAINGDADMVWRGTIISANFSIANAQTNGLHIRVRDPLGKGYASTGNGQAAWLRAAWLFAEPGKPGLWFPELYIGKGQQFSYDLRNTNPTNPAAGQFTLEGGKVYGK